MTHFHPRNGRCPLTRGVMQMTALHSRPKRFVVLLAALAALLLAHHQAAATPFTTETVDATGTTGFWTSLAIDPQGDPHISYYDLGSGDLRYAKRIGGVWSFETVDAGGNVGSYTSIAIDAQGNPHISYHDETNLDLKYATKVGGAWTIQTVEGAGGISLGLYTSIAIDAQGLPHISYYDQTNGNLKYARNTGGGWAVQTVDGGSSDTGMFTSLALDATGLARISYHEVTGGDLRIAWRTTSGSFLIESLESTGIVGMWTSLALDAAGIPRICYYDQTNSNLKYITKESGAWVAETVPDPFLVAGQFGSLAVDAQGIPHISYQAESPYSVLRYARKVGGSWIIESVDVLGSQGLETSLELDAQGNPRISYREINANDLKYADASVRLVNPVAGQIWPVGGVREVRWAGVGPVDVKLSADGGASFQTLASGVVDNSFTFQVPHLPTHFGRIGVFRASPISSSVSTGHFIIEASIGLLSLNAEWERGVAEARISWRTNPGPEDLAGYRLERALPGSRGGWETVVALTRETSYTDRGAAAGNRYRLFAINGLGHERLLGEAALLPARSLAAWPLPYKAGELTVSFGVAGGIGGGLGIAEVAVFDLSGRRVRTLASGAFESGYRTATWNGRDESGTRVPGGVYFVRAATGGEVAQLKLVVMP